MTDHSVTPPPGGNTHAVRQYCEIGLMDEGVIRMLAGSNTTVRQSSRNMK